MKLQTVCAASAFYDIWQILTRYFLETAFRSLKADLNESHFLACNFGSKATDLVEVDFIF